MNSAFISCQRRNGWWRLLVPLILVLLLSGCQALSEHMCRLQNCDALSPEGDTKSAERALLDELRQIRTLTDEQRQQRYQMLRPQLESSNCRLDNVRTTMLYFTLNTPPQDDLAQLSGAMKTCMEEGAPQTFRGMAYLLHSELAQHTANTTRIHDLEQMVNREQARNAALTEQLEALKAIERSLRDRDRNSTNTRED